MQTLPSLGKSFAPSQAEQLPKLSPPFLFFPLFWEYLKSQVRINKIVNSLPTLPYKNSLKGTSSHISINSLENALIWDIFTHASPPPHSKLTLKFLSSRTRRALITHSSRQHSFKNLFPLTAETGGWRKLWVALSKFIRKYEDDLEH